MSRAKPPSDMAKWKRWQALARRESRPRKHPVMVDGRVPDDPVCQVSNAFHVTRQTEPPDSKALTLPCRHCPLLFARSATTATASGHIADGWVKKADRRLSAFIGDTKVCSFDVHMCEQRDAYLRQSTGPGLNNKKEDKNWQWVAFRESELCLFDHPHVQIWLKFDATTPEDASSVAFVHRFQFDKESSRVRHRVELDPTLCKKPHARVEILYDAQTFDASDFRLTLDTLQKIKKKRSDPTRWVDLERKVLYDSSSGSPSNDSPAATSGSGSPSPHRDSRSPPVAVADGFQSMLPTLPPPPQTSPVPIDPSTPLPLHSGMVPTSGNSVSRSRSPPSSHSEAGVPPPSLQLSADMTLPPLDGGGGATQQRRIQSLEKVVQDLQRNLKGMYESNWTLKKRNGHLERENRELKEKLQQVQAVLGGGGGGANHSSSFPVAGANSMLPPTLLGANASSSSDLFAIAPSSSSSSVSSASSQASSNGSGAGGGSAPSYAHHHQHQHSSASPSPSFSSSSGGSAPPPGPMMPPLDLPSSVSAMMLSGGRGLMLPQAHASSAAASSSSSHQQRKRGASSQTAPIDPLHPSFLNSSTIQSRSKRARNAPSASDSASLTAAAGGSPIPSFPSMPPMGGEHSLLHPHTPLVPGTPTTGGGHMVDDFCASTSSMPSHMSGDGVPLAFDREDDTGLDLFSDYDAGGLAVHLDDGDNLLLRNAPSTRASAAKGHAAAWRSTQLRDLGAPSPSSSSSASSSDVKPKLEPRHRPASSSSLPPSSFTSSATPSVSSSSHLPPLTPIPSLCAPPDSAFASSSALPTPSFSSGVPGNLALPPLPPTAPMFSSSCSPSLSPSSLATRSSKLREVTFKEERVDEDMAALSPFGDHLDSLLPNLEELCGGESSASDDAFKTEHASHQGVSTPVFYHGLLEERTFPLESVGPVDVVPMKDKARNAHTERGQCANSSAGTARAKEPSRRSDPPEACPPPSCAVPKEQSKSPKPKKARSKAKNRSTKARAKQSSSSRSSPPQRAGSASDVLQIGDDNGLDDLEHAMHSMSLYDRVEGDGDAFVPAVIRALLLEAKGGAMRPQALARAVTARSRAPHADYHRHDVNKVLYQMQKRGEVTKGKNAQGRPVWSLVRAAE